MKSECNEINQHWMSHVGSCWSDQILIPSLLPLLLRFLLSFLYLVSGENGAGELEFIFHLPQRNTHSLDYKLHTCTDLANKAHLTAYFRTSWDIVEIAFLLRDSELAWGYLGFSALPGVQCLHPLIALVSALTPGETWHDLGEKLSKMENIDIMGIINCFFGN